MPALIERPKMSVEMWNALKRHIMKEREKKKQEQEEHAAEEQMRREQEMKRKRDETSIEEIKEKVARVNKKLEEAKEEKEQMFNQLKKVLHEEQARRREKESVDNNELMAFAAAYPNIAVGHPSAQFYMLNQNQLLSPGRPPAVMYKVAPPQQSLGTPGTSHKRTRSPSPPAPGSYQSSYNYKYPPPMGPGGVVPEVTYTGGPYYPPSSFPPTYAAGAPGPPQFDQPTSSKHHYLATPSASSSRHHEPPSSYEQPSSSKSHPTYQMATPQGYMGGLPSQMEHPKPGYPEEKYYVQSKLMMGHMQDSYHTSPKLMNTREGGGITSGYPVRSQPTPSSTSASSTYVGHSYQGPPPPTSRFY